MGWILLFTVNILLQILQTSWLETKTEAIGCPESKDQSWNSWKSFISEVNIALFKKIKPSHSAANLSAKANSLPTVVNCR